MSHPLARVLIVAVVALAIIVGYNLRIRDAIVDFGVQVSGSRQVSRSIRLATDPSGHQSGTLQCTHRWSSLLSAWASSPPL